MSFLACNFNIFLYVYIDGWTHDVHRMHKYINCYRAICGNLCTWAHDVHHLPNRTSTVHQSYRTVQHVSKCMGCHKAIVVITGREHPFHNYIYIILILLLWDLSTLCVSLMTTYMHTYIYTYIHFCIYIYLRLYVI